MLDIKWVLNNLEAVKKALDQRGLAMDLGAFTALNEERKRLQKEHDDLRALQNQKSKEIASLKREGKDAQAVIDEMSAVAARLKAISQKQGEVQARLTEMGLAIPNIPHASVPVGSTEEDNVLVREWGTKPSFSFKPREHWELGENLGLLDFERAARIAGARFSITSGALAKMERALIHFMLELHITEHGYEEVLPPFMVNEDTLVGTGQLPKFGEELFKTTAGYYLIPTAEVPVTNMYRGETLSHKVLPKKFCAYTPCFRSEAGSYGKDTRGLIRLHQFNKVELVKITAPETSYDELESLTRDAERVLELLGLPYRTMVLCTGDMGFAAAKTYDIEVWLPGQNRYREISSCSNCTDFQARRMQTRLKDQNGKCHYVHTLNGSGLAVGRTLIAILENYQNADGSITVPEALREFMGTDRIAGKAG